MRPDRRTDTKTELLAGESAVERKTGLRGPAGWWVIGLVVLALLIAILLVPQLMGGGTAMIPGTPMAAPANGPATPPPGDVPEPGSSPG